VGGGESCHEMAWGGMRGALAPLFIAMVGGLCKAQIYIEKNIIKLINEEIK
jgi:hypothetical protein